VHRTPRAGGVASQQTTSGTSSAARSVGVRTQSTPTRVRLALAFSTRRRRPRAHASTWSSASSRP